MQYIALPTETVRTLQSGAPDANGKMPERHISNGSANPCRHCLRDIPKGAEMLILSYRPFDDLHPYAETGPIFLCADACAQGGGHQVPDILQTSPDYLIKGIMPMTASFTAQALLSRRRILRRMQHRYSLTRRAHICTSGPRVTIATRCGWTAINGDLSLGQALGIRGRSIAYSQGHPDEPRRARDTDREHVPHRL